MAFFPSPPFTAHQIEEAATAELLKVFLLVETTGTERLKLLLFLPLLSFPELWGVRLREWE